MCGRVIADLTPQHWALLGVPVPSVAPRYNATRSATLGLLRAEDGERFITPARWGLVPEDMNRAQADQLALFNARIETVASKPAFRDAWKRRHALLPVTGWIEWRPNPQGGRKLPYLVRRRDHKPVVLAALWTDDDGQPTFAVITTPAQPALTWLHERQPLVLPAAQWDAWLAGSRDELNPVPAHVYEVLPLDSAINDARMDHPGVVRITGEPVRGAA